jgi:Winged helix-turn helix
VPEDRRRLEAIVSDRNASQKHVWRAKIILATADGCGTDEIMRRSGKAKPVVWRWQARFVAEGIAGLTRDKTRKPGKPIPCGHRAGGWLRVLVSPATIPSGLIHSPRSMRPNSLRPYDCPGRSHAVAQPLRHFSMAAGLRTGNGLNCPWRVRQDIFCSQPLSLPPPAL